MHRMAGSGVESLKDYNAFSETHKERFALFALTPTGPKLDSGWINFHLHTMETHHLFAHGASGGGDPPPHPLDMASGVEALRLESRGADGKSKNVTP